jgi:hypothetical protein
MDKTLFAGLTRLGPGESLSLDGYSFITENPTILDYYLRLALTRRFDGHALLVDPTADPAASVSATGGTIPGDLSISVLYTLLDADGGETLPNTTTITVETPIGLSDPESAPTLTADTVAGDLLAGTYTYALTVTDGAGGESGLGAEASIDIELGSATNEVVISGLASIVTESGATGWRLWRDVDGNGWNLVESGTTDTVTDDGTLCPNCNVQPPEAGNGSTNGTNRLLVTVPAIGQPSEAVSFRIYASVDGAFGSPALLGEYPVADFDVEKVYTNLSLLPGSPPDISRALAGRALIDPTIEIDWTAIAGGAALLAAETPHVVNASGGSAPAFSAGWSAVDSVAFWLDATGAGRMKGSARKATAPADGDVIFTIPWVVNKPLATRRVATVSEDATPSRVVGFLEVQTDGDVVWRGGASGTDNLISLDVSYAI